MDERETVSITMPLYSFPVPGSPLDKAIDYCWRTSDVPFTRKLFIPREHVNELIRTVYRLNREIERLKADK